MNKRNEPMYACVDAPGHYGDIARVYETFATLTEARHWAAASGGGVIIYRGYWEPRDLVPRAELMNREWWTAGDGDETTVPEEVRS